MQRLRDAARTYLAWKSIVEDVGNRRMDLGTYQADQAKRAMDMAEDALKQMVRETYRWLMVPAEEMVRGKLTLRWEAVSVTASSPSLVDEIENKLKEEEWVVYAWSPVHLNRMLNQWYFKEGVNAVPALRVWQDCCQYLYLPRLLNTDVFEQAVAAGCARRDGFAFADGKEGEQWQGFSFGQNALVTVREGAWLISHDAAIHHQGQLEEEERRRQANLATPAVKEPGANGTAPVAGNGTSTGGGRSLSAGAGATPQTQFPATLPQRFFGTVEVEADVATLDFSTIVNEVIQNFTAQTGVEVKITVEIEAQYREGFQAALQRAIKENCAVLKFRNAEFE